MCGISGVFSMSDEPAPDVLDAMNEALLHRGPDGFGVFKEGRVGLAMRRLSIIGLNNGRQPMRSEDDAVVAVVNGELYDYRAVRAQLRERGHRFATESDSEIVVHLYEEFGPGFLDHVNGMFALALYDKRQETLFLARDRLGKKPLYYAFQDGTLVFGSEIKAIHASGIVDKELDPSGLEDYLANGFVSGPHTMFRRVCKLSPGSVLTATRDGSDIRRYWRLPKSSGSMPEREEAESTIRTLLTNAVESRLMSEVPLGAFLSGGLDSSAVVGLMAHRLAEPVETFSVGFNDSRLDELAHARVAAQHFATRHHELVLHRCTAGLLGEVNWFQDEPAGDPAAVPTFCLSKHAKEHVTVVLTGEGGDELFGGYRHYQLCSQLRRLERSLPFSKTIARAAGALEPGLSGLTPARLWKGLWLMGLGPYDRVDAWWSAFTDRELTRLLRSEYRDVPRENAVEPDTASVPGLHDELAELLYHDTEVPLAEQLLMKVDKMTMANSLEARCPLLDRELVETVAGLPLALKFTPDSVKGLLRRAVETTLPDEISARPKQGFDVPLDRWLRDDLRELSGQLLFGPKSPVSDFFDADQLRSRWNVFDRRPDRRTGLQLWRILNFAVWHEIHWPSDRNEPLLSPPTSRSNDRETLSSERVLEFAR